jgi:hypothetical protein
VSGLLLRVGKRLLGLSILLFGHFAAILRGVRRLLWLVSCMTLGHLSPVLHRNVSLPPLNRDMMFSYIK